MNERDSSGGVFREGEPPMTGGASGSDPTCKMCRTGTIASAKVYRMNNTVVIVGYLLLVLSMIGVCLAGLAFLINSARPAGNLNELEAGFESFRAGLARDFAVCFGFACVVAASFSWLLVTKKRVLKCNHCGVVVPDSLRGMYGEIK